MAKKNEEQQEEVKITAKIFADRAISNKHYRFHLEKKYANQEKTEDEWKEVCAQENIELNN